MTLATPVHDPADRQEFADGLGTMDFCVHCGTTLWSRVVDPHNPTPYPAPPRVTWHHAYRDWAYGQMTCDPQLAREAARPLMGQLA